tara:strand:- start:23 stop:3220 length:3198 start_codon:yes stop_codon:yes gene_type:complete
MANPMVTFEGHLGRLKKRLADVAQHSDFSAQGLSKLAIATAKANKSLEYATKILTKMAGKDQAAAKATLNLVASMEKLHDAAIKENAIRDKKIQALQRDIIAQEDAKRSLQDYNKHQEKAKMIAEAKANAVKRLAKEEKELRIQAKKMADTAIKESNARKKAVIASQNHTLKLKALMRNMQKAGIDTAKFAKENKKLIQASKKSAFAMDKLTMATQRFNVKAKKGWFAVRNFRNGTEGLGMKLSVLRSKLLLAAFAVTMFTRSIGRHIKSSIDASAQFEVLRTRLTALYGSVQRGSQAFDKFNKVAATTPFQLQNVVDAGAKLKAFGVDAEDMIKPVADLAAFMGVDIVEAAGAMGRAFAGGAGAADVLRERGILQLIKTTQGIADLSKKTLPEFRDALITTLKDPMTGIAGSTTKLAATYQGALSNMQDATTRAKAAIGDRFSDLSKSVVSSLTEMAVSIEAFAKKDLQALYDMARKAGTDQELIDVLGKMIDTEKAKKAALVLRGDLSGAFRDLNTEIGDFALAAGLIDESTAKFKGFDKTSLSIRTSKIALSDLIPIQELASKKARELGESIDWEYEKIKAGVDVDLESLLVNKNRIKNYNKIIDVITKMFGVQAASTLEAKNEIKVSKSTVETTKEHIRNLNTLREAYYSTSQGQLELLNRQIDSMKVGLLNAKITGETTEEYSMLSIILNSLIEKHKSLDPVYQAYLKQQKEDLKAQKELVKERQAGVDALAESFPTLEEYTKKLFIKLQMENHEKDLKKEIIKLNYELAVSLGLVDETLAGNIKRLEATNNQHTILSGILSGLGGTMDFSAFIKAEEAIADLHLFSPDSEEYATAMQAKIDATANMYSQLGAMTMQFLQEENARNESRIRAEGKRELDSLKQTMKYKRSSDAQKKVLEDAALKDSNDRLKKNFRAQQAMAISSIIMDTASALFKSVEGAWVTMGQPWAGMILALSAAQIGLVSSQKPPTMEQGGLIGGRRHSQGGTIIEAEQGEFIMSRSAVQSVGLESLNRMNEGGGGSSVTVNVSGNVLSQDFVEGELAENIKEAIRRGGKEQFGLS